MDGSLANRIVLLHIVKGFEIKLCQSAGIPFALPGFIITADQIRFILQAKALKLSQGKGLIKLE